MANGIRIAEKTHVVNVLPPVDITGGTKTQAVSLANASHVSFVIQIGVSAAAPGAVTVQAGTATAAIGADVTGAAAIAFNVHKQETAGAAKDTLGSRTAVAATGFTPAATDGIFYVIEVDSAELPAGSSYVQVCMANTTNSVIASCVAILSGLRYTGIDTVTA
jgi:hypothetical protein